MLDDLSAGHAESVPPVFRWCRRGFTIARAVSQTLRQHGIDAVMHFAAWLSVSESVHDPLGYYENNVVGSLALLERDGRTRGSSGWCFRRPARSTASRPRSPIAE